MFADKTIWACSKTKHRQICSQNRFHGCTYLSAPCWENVVKYGKCWNYWPYQLQYTIKTTEQCSVVLLSVFKYGKWGAVTWEERESSSESTLHYNIPRIWIICSSQIFCVIVTVMILCGMCSRFPEPSEIWVNKSNLDRSGWVFNFWH